MKDCKGFLCGLVNECCKLDKKDCCTNCEYFCDCSACLFTKDDSDICK